MTRSVPPPASRSSFTPCSRTPTPLTRRRRALVSRASTFVRRLAERVARKYYGLVAPSDLASLGYEGLVEAALRYDPDRGVPLEGFAHPRVLGAMLDGVRAEASRRREARIVASIAAERGGHGAEAPISGERVSLTTAGADSRNAVAVRAAAVLDAMEPSDARASGDPRAEAIAAALARLPRADRDLFHALYALDQTLPELARDLGVSPRTLVRRKRALLRKLANELHRRRERR